MSFIDMEIIYAQGMLDGSYSQEAKKPDGRDGKQQSRRAASIELLVVHKVYCQYKHTVV